VQTFIQDLRYALRQMRIAPAFTLTAVLTLAIGIGATTAIFTLVHAIMLKSLPVTDPARLYRIGDSQECCIEGWEDDDWSLFSHQLYQRLAAPAPEFEETTAFQAASNTYGIRSQSRDHEARPLRAEFVTGNYFHVFGVGALMGRVIAPSDDQPSAPPVGTAPALNAALRMQLIPRDTFKVAISVLCDQAKKETANGRYIFPGGTYPFRRKFVSLNIGAAPDPNLDLADLALRIRIP
jgi:hypothetical protein